MADIDVINVGGVDYNIKDTTARNAISSQVVPVDHSSTDGKYGIGTSTKVGHVRPVDAFSSLVGSADQGIVASQKAVYDAYINCAHTQKQTENANFVTQPSITSLEGSSVANHPFNNGTYCTLYTWGNYGNYATQLAVPWTQSYHQIAFRSLVNGTWGPWKYITDTVRTTGTATTNTTNAVSWQSDGGVAYYYRSGNVCMVNTFFRRTNNVSQLNTDYVIASGLPKAIWLMEAFPCWIAYNKTSAERYSAKITTNGELIFAVAGSLPDTTADLCGSFTYICTD